MLFIGCPYCFNAGLLTNEALHDITEKGTANIACYKCKSILQLEVINGIITVKKDEEKGEDENEIEIENDSMCRQELGNRIQKSVAI